MLWLNKINRFLEKLSHIKNIKKKVLNKDKIEPIEENTFQVVKASG